MSYAPAGSPRRGFAGGSGARGLEHLGQSAAHRDLTDRRLDALDLDSLELLADEVRRQLHGALRRLTVVTGGDRQHDAVAAVEELIRDEARHRLDPGGEGLVDSADELLHLLRVDLVLAHAGVHGPSCPPRPVLRATLPVSRGHVRRGGRANTPERGDTADPPRPR